ncbi:hypothetical protein, partial [Ligilactobacillus ruminis]|uniref:hypothetical protein n=1 Tax=Ligilactobacillus ruminis TaxID=1623 RepID=UPI003F9859E7
FVCPPSIILLGDLIIPGRRALGSLFFINLHHYTGITLSAPRTTILNQPLDKNHTFPPVFVYWPQRFKGDYGQNGDF